MLCAVALLRGRAPGRTAMEQLIAGAKFPAKCVKNEIHNLLTTLRLTRHKSTYGPQAQFHYESLRSFQRLFEDLTYIHELHEFDTVAYLGPFLDVIQSDATDGQMTAVALAAVNKFVSFGLINPESPRCMEAINTLAWGVIKCRFVSSGNAHDEVVLLKMVGLLIDCLRCPAGEYLSDTCVWHMVRKCFQISRQPKSSHLLRSSAEDMLQQMVLTIFGTHKERTNRVKVKAGDTASATGQGLQVYRPYGFRAMLFVLRFISILLDVGKPSAPAGADKVKRRRAPHTPRSRSPSCERLESPRRTEDGASDVSLHSREEQTTDLDLGQVVTGPDDKSVEAHRLGLSLLNIALECGGDEIAKSDELIRVIQEDICKSLLQNSRTESLAVLSLICRAIFNLFLHFKRHIKVQLEMFFTSVHLKIAVSASASYEQRELVLESLLEFCREPELMIEVYENYDCDVRCTNLFEDLVRFLVTNAFPPDGVNGVKGGFNSLHRLALSGLLSILHSIALRCDGHGHFRGEGAGAGPVAALSAAATEEVAAAETELQRKKEQKRRLSIAARTFNGDPSKSMSALQSLGLVSTPPTAESMAEFLRHTPELDLRLVGEYLSKRKDFNGEVRKAFLSLFHFEGMPLVEALRTVLNSFRLPGESQLIERLMESFAEAYFVAQAPVVEAGAATETTQDPLKMPRWVFREKAPDMCSETGGGPEDAAGETPTRMRMSNSDTIFVLSYSIIMLNTDLHNPGVKNRMTVEQFRSNNRGIDDGKSLPDFFLNDIYEAIRDDEIRLHGEAPVSGEIVVDDFFWEGVLKRSESIDEFSTTERLLSECAPGATERDILHVIMECSPLPVLSLCYESVPDASVASQAMMGFQDLAKINAYYGQVDAVNSLVRVTCQFFSRESAGGVLSMRSQIALRASQQFVAQHVLLFRETEWRILLDVLLQMWALGLLPQHLAEFDDFAGPDGKPLESLCNLKPPFTPPEPALVDNSEGQAYTGASALRRQSSLYADTSGDGFLETLTRWFEDETRDEDDEISIQQSRLGDGGFSLVVDSLSAGGSAVVGSDADALPVESKDPAVVHQKVKQIISRSGFVELFTPPGISKLSAESLQILAKALVLLSRPAKWSATPGSVSPSAPTTSPPDRTPAQADFSHSANLSGPRMEAAADWHDVADPVFCLELLTNMTCMPLGPGQSVSQIWPLVSTHFERLLQYVTAGGGSSEQQFIERLIVNTLRLSIRLIGNAELVQTLLTLNQHLSRLPPGLFETYAERIACGLLILVKETNLPHSGLSTIFTLLRRISETPTNTGACSAGIEVVNYWLSDDQELSRILSLQQFPELLASLRALAVQNSSPASATALGHLSSLVPQLARGARSLQNATGQWQSLWVPVLHVLADIAKQGGQKPSAQAFVFLQRLLLERGTEMSLPWEQLPFTAWKECLEQVLFPLLQAPSSGDVPAELAGARQANAAQLLCRVTLTHLPEWLRDSQGALPVIFLRLVHVLVSEASSSTSHAREPIVECLKNMLLVLSADPAFNELSSPKHGETLLQATWGVVSASLPDLQREIQLILDPSAADMSPPAAARPPQDVAPGGDASGGFGVPAPGGYPAQGRANMAAGAPP